MNLYEQFFAPQTRGYLFIRAFHGKNFNRFRRTDLEDPDAMINQVFLSVSKIKPESIAGPIENYVIRAIAYQCWRILEKEINRQRHQQSDRVATSDGETVGVEELAKDLALPDEKLDAGDLWGLLVHFRQSLKKRDRQIFNSLIEGDRPIEMARKLRLSENAVNVRLLRLRRRVALYLKQIGYAENILKGLSSSRHYLSKKTR